MKALVTGGSGFLGVHLTRALQEEGHGVRVVDLVPFPAGDGLSPEFIRGDIRDRALTERACRGIDVVFHGASLVPLSRSGGEFLRVNVEGTRAVLAAAARERVRRVVHISSSAVYGRPAQAPLTERSPARPLEAYGLSKKMAEDVCRDYRGRGLDVVIVRPRTLVGRGRLGILHLLFEWISLGKRFYILGPGANRFQLLSAADCASACLLAARGPCAGEDFNLGAERFGSLREDLEALAAHAGTGARIVSLSPRWARPALRLLDALRLTPLVSLHYATVDADWFFDAAKARRLLGWRPRDSNLEMLAAAYDWFVADRGRTRWSDSSVSAHRRPVRDGVLAALKRLS
jgi:nucleoside-diphosphate-sugar epimerase